MLKARAPLPWRSRTWLEVLSGGLPATRKECYQQLSAGTIPQSRSQARYSTTTTHDHAATPKDIPQPSQTRRTIRWTIRIVVGLTVSVAAGFATGWGLKTYNYIRQGRILDSKGHGPYTAVSKKILEKSQIVQSLRNEGWVEHKSPKEHAAGDRPGEHHFVDNVLAHKGLSIKYFQHPTDPVTIVVFCADYGCESWPHTVHGGVTTSLIEQALNLHSGYYAGSLEELYDRCLSMNYLQPVTTPGLHSIVVYTHSTEIPSQFPAIESDHRSLAVRVKVVNLTRVPKFTGDLSGGELQLFEQMPEDRRVEALAGLFVKDKQSQSVDKYPSGESVKGVEQKWIADTEQSVKSTMTRLGTSRRNRQTQSKASP